MFDFVRLFNDYSIEFRVDAENWVNIECPICHHSGDRGFKGGCNIAGGYFHCWACGGHKIEDVLISLLSVDYREAKKIIEEYSMGVPKRLKLKSKNKKSPIVLPCDYLDDRCKEYLRSRRFDPERIEKKYHIVGAPMSGQYAGRLIIPIIYKKKIVAFQGRSLLSKERCTELGILRYITSSRKESIIDPKTILYNLDNCKGENICIVEGVFDQWRMGKNVAATLGTSTTEEQCLLLTKYKRIFIMFDPEPLALKRARKFGRQLAMLCTPTTHIEIIKTNFGHDPGDMTKKEVNFMRKELGL